MNPNLNQSGRKLGAKNKVNIRVKNIIADAIEERLPQIFERLDELPLKDQANVVIALVKYVVPSQKEQSVEVTQPEGKVNYYDPTTFDTILESFKKN
mgnify:CR=1 FL=1